MNNWIAITVCFVALSACGNDAAGNASGLGATDSNMGGSTSDTQGATSAASALTGGDSGGSGGTGGTDGTNATTDDSGDGISTGEPDPTVPKACAEWGVLYAETMAAAELAHTACTIALPQLQTCAYYVSKAACDGALSQAEAGALALAETVCPMSFDQCKANGAQCVADAYVNRGVLFATQCDGPQDVGVLDDISDAVFEQCDDDKQACNDSCSSWNEDHLAELLDLADVLNMCELGCPGNGISCLSLGCRAQCNVTYAQDLQSLYNDGSDCMVDESDLENCNEGAYGDALDDFENNCDNQGDAQDIWIQQQADLQDCQP